MALPEEPIFGTIIGQRIKANRDADADRQLAQKAIRDANVAAEEASEVAMKGARIAEFLREELDQALQSEMDLRAAITGIRAVSRDVMAELKVADPNNPLLDKKVRDRIFDQAKEGQIKRMEKDDIKTRREKSAAHRDEVFGAPNSNKGGPEKENITPNKAIRDSAEVDDHVPDRERFLVLIRSLCEELEKVNPNAQILQEKEVKDVFETFALNEMVRMDKNKNIFGGF